MGMEKIFLFKLNGVLENGLVLCTAFLELAILT